MSLGNTLRYKSLIGEGPIVKRDYCLLFCKASIAKTTGVQQKFK